MALQAVLQVTVLDRRPYRPARDQRGAARGSNAEAALKTPTMIVVTHEMGFAREVADRVCFLHSGTIVEEGAAAQVLGAPQHARTQDFLRRVLQAPIKGDA